MTFLSMLPMVGTVSYDVRYFPFLVAGYKAYTESVRGTCNSNPLVHTAYHLAKSMFGGALTRSRAKDENAQHTVTSVAHDGVVPVTPTVQVDETVDFPVSLTTDLNPPHDEPTVSAHSSPKKRRRSEGERVGDAVKVVPTIELIRTITRYLKRFKLDFREEIFAIQNLGNTLDLHENMADLFDTMLNRQREAVNANAGDMCVIEVRGSETVDKPVWFSLRRTDQINGHVILDKISHVLNSNQSFLSEGALHFSYIHVPLPEAGGKGTKRPNEIMSHFRKTH